MDVAAPSAEQRTGCSDSDRFVIELEFVQALSNPAYLNWLAQNKYLDDEAFLAYIKYLDGYWRRPEYVRYLQYPHCLFFLQQLQHEDFRKAIAKPQTAEFIHTQQFRFWQHFWTERVREGLQRAGDRVASAASHAPTAS